VSREPLPAKGYTVFLFGRALVKDIFLAFARCSKTGKIKLWKQYKAECDKYPEKLTRIPTEFAVPQTSKAPKEVWRSRGFVVQVYDVNEEWERLSIHRNAFDSHFTRFLDGISWEKIQELKAECGRGSSEAVEIFPSEVDATNSNYRHIWVRKVGSFMREEGIGWLNVQSV
jgi:hypothetical protein